MYCMCILKPFDNYEKVKFSNEVLTLASKYAISRSNKKGIAKFNFFVIIKWF